MHKYIIEQTVTLYVPKCVDIICSPMVAFQENLHLFKQYQMFNGVYKHILSNQLQFPM